MPRKPRVQVKAPIRLDKGSARARVPTPVREALGGGVGDSLVFEEGCDEAVQRAALRGPYFVVRVERAASAAPEEPPARAAEPTLSRTPELEPFADAVRKKMGGGA